MDNALSNKFPNDRKITIRNPKDGRVITRQWVSAKHLVDRGWEIIGSEALEVEQVKKSPENGDASHVANVKVNNPDLFSLEELKVKYKDLTGRMPNHKWNKEKILEKIKDYAPVD